MGKGCWIELLVVGVVAVGAAAADVEFEVVVGLGLEMVVEVRMRLVVGETAVGKEAIGVAELDKMVAVVGIGVDLVESVVLGTAVVVPAARMVVEDENTFVVKVVVAVEPATTAGRLVRSLAEIVEGEAVVEKGRTLTETRDLHGLYMVAGRADEH